MSYDRQVEHIECYICHVTPPINLAGGNRYRWMYIHMAEHFDKGEHPDALSTE